MKLSFAIAPACRLCYRVEPADARYTAKSTSTPASMSWVDTTCMELVLKRLPDGSSLALLCRARALRWNAPGSTRLACRALWHKARIYDASAWGADLSASSHRQAIPAEGIHPAEFLIAGGRARSPVSPCPPGAVLPGPAVWLCRGSLSMVIGRARESAQARPQMMRAASELCLDDDAPGYVVQFAATRAIGEQ